MTKPKPKRRGENLPGSTWTVKRQIISDVPLRKRATAFHILQGFAEMSNSEGMAITTENAARYFSCSDSDAAGAILRMKNAGWIERRKALVITDTGHRLIRAATPRAKPEARNRTEFQPVDEAAARARFNADRSGELRRHLLAYVRDNPGCYPAQIGKGLYGNGERDTGIRGVFDRACAAGHIRAVKQNVTAVDGRNIFARCATITEQGLSVLAKLEAVQ